MKAALAFRKKNRVCPLKPGIRLLLIMLVFFLISCARQENQEQVLSWPEEETPEESEPALPPPPGITDEIYVDITARAALIFDKYKEDLDEAHHQMDLVYQKHGVTFADYDRYRRNLTPDKKRKLEKLVQEHIQKVYKEYFGPHE